MSKRRCKPVIIIIISIELLCLYAMPLGVGSINSPYIGSSYNRYRVQEGMRGGGGRWGVPLILAICRRNSIPMF